MKKSFMFHGFLSICSAVDQNEATGPASKSNIQVQKEIQPPKSVLV